MTTIYLIRHAEAEGNLYRRAHGWYNSTITDRGYRQIAALAKRFADTKFDAVYSSDRFRTMITALSIYKTHGLPLRTVRALREIDVGYWEDTPWAELKRTDPEQLSYFSNDAQKWHVDGCESFAEVRDRMRKALADIAEAHPGETVAIFSHGMAMRIIIGTLQGMTLHEIDKTGHAENTAVAKLEYENGNFHVIFRDDASHLGGDIATIRKQPWGNDPKGFEGGIYYRASGESGHFDVMHIYYRASGESGHFDVMHSNNVIGAVSVESCRGGVGTIGEFWLEEDARKRDLGEKLVGQALSYARSRGCSILSTGRIAKSNSAGLHCAEKWGFRPVCEDAESVTLEKNFEYDEESCWKRLQKVIEK